MAEAAGRVRRHSRRSGARRRLGATMERRAQGQTSGAVSSACLACARLTWALLLLAQLRTIAAAYLACPGSCADLWELPRVQSGPAFAALNAASGLNHTDLIQLLTDTTADLPFAQQIFRVNTLISGPLLAGNESEPMIFLGPTVAGLLLGSSEYQSTRAMHSGRMLPTLSTMTAITCDSCFLSILLPQM